MKTKQIQFTKPYTAELIEIECPTPKADEVTVTLHYSAISAGTEKANFIGQRNGILQAEDQEAVFPRTVGYSAAGIVTAIGADVRDIAIKDRVAVFWGKHQKQITLSRSQVMKISDAVSLQEASMALIATFPLAAIRKTRLEIGESALIMGLGILGIFAVMECRAAGAYPIIAADPVKERREFALKMGADHALDPTDDSFLEAVKQLSCGGASICIESTGLGIGLIQALDCMRPMGRIALLGCTRSSIFEIDYYTKVHGRGISLIGAHTAARPKTESSAGYWTEQDDLKTVFGLIEGKRLPFSDMICETVSPADAQAVYTRLVSESNSPIGILFDWRELA